MTTAYQYSAFKLIARNLSCLKLCLLIEVSIILLGMILLTACSNQYAQSGDGGSSEIYSSEKASETDWGVSPIGIRLTATDYMLDFRYRVTDAEKAAAIINRKTKPYLIVEKTGVILNVPSSYKVGPLRQSAQFAQENRNYFMLFANPGRHVKAGDEVTVVAGDFKLEHLVVQ